MNSILTDIKRFVYVFEDNAGWYQVEAASLSDAFEELSKLTNSKIKLVDTYPRKDRVNFQHFISREEPFNKRLKGIRNDIFSWNFSEYTL
jgi:hypothetical protein